MTTPATQVVDHSDTSAFDADQAAIWAEQKAMYTAFLVGDRARLDRFIHPDATIWDAVTEGLAYGLTDLDRIRATRPTGAQAPVTTRLEVDAPVVDIGRDLAVSRHRLLVEHAGPDGRFRALMRVSAGWRRLDGSWYVIHSHEDLFSVEQVD